MWLAPAPPPPPLPAFVSVCLSGCWNRCKIVLCLPGAVPVLALCGGVATGLLASHSLSWFCLQHRSAPSSGYHGRDEWLQGPAAHPHLPNVLATRAAAATLVPARAAGVQSSARHPPDETTLSVLRMWPLEQPQEGRRACIAGGAGGAPTWSAGASFGACASSASSASCATAFHGCQ